MKISVSKMCPYCCSKELRRKGYYLVRIFGIYRRRYGCKSCGRSFSSQTKLRTYRQKRPDLNGQISKLLVNGLPQRGIARVLGCARSTVEKKFVWLTSEETPVPRITSPDTLFIDEMESIEHSKLKPLTIPLAVGDNYRILGTQVGRIPAKGYLAGISIKKYGHRPSEKSKVLRLLFENLDSCLIGSPKVIRTDASPFYKSLVTEFFPKARHEVFESRAFIQKKKEMLFLAENKKLFDPLFPLNQRCAKLRADIRRLTRRSWCTTKKPENLARHLNLYLSCQKTE